MIAERLEGLDISGTGTGTGTGADSEQPKLYVRVTPMHHPTTSVDPSLDSLIYVNDDANPVLINNEHFTGHVVFRVRGFHGWTPLDEKTGKPKPPIDDCPHYFAGHKRSFSLQVSGRFRQQWTGDDIMFGTFFDHPIKLPRGSSIALAFAQRIDPSMTYENNDKPYICSPIICAMNTIHIQPLLAGRRKRETPAPDSSEEDHDRLHNPHNNPHNHPHNNPHNINSNSQGDDQQVSEQSSLYEVALRCQEEKMGKLPNTEPLCLPPWKYGKGQSGGILEENLMAEWPSWTLAPSGGSQMVPGSANSIAGTGPHEAMSSALIKAVSKNKISPSHRRQWFLDEKHRQKFIFHPDTVYSFDFASPYVDMNEIVLKLGINISVPPFLDGQPVRYQCRSRDGSVIFWTLEIALK